jgi:hypothetical protein
VTNASEVEELTETLKQKVQEKVQRIRRHEKVKPSITKIKCSKTSPKIFTESRGKKYIDVRDPHLLQL